MTVRDGYPRGLTGVNRGRHNFITMQPGQFLGEYNVPLVGGKVSGLKIKSPLAVTERTNLLWPYSWPKPCFRLCGESLKVAKSRPEPKNDTPCVLAAELVLTTRDLFSGVEALKSAGKSSFVKKKGPGCGRRSKCTLSYQR